MYKGIGKEESRDEQVCSQSTLPLHSIKFDEEAPEIMLEAHDEGQVDQTLREQNGRAPLLLQAQQNIKQMDEELTTTAYPNVQENLKLPTECQVIIEEPASSTRTLSSLQNLDKELNFTNQLFIEKPQEEEYEKTNTESEV
ncbi:hypothetical protein Tco_0290392 [Tanacetum coccineum]